MNQPAAELWPSMWEGNSIIDCGNHGRLSLKIDVHGNPAEPHLTNFNGILLRWKDIWEIVVDLVEAMSADYEDIPKIGSHTASVLISLPNEHIQQGVNWNVAIVFNNHDGIWHVEFDGWEFSSDGTQPYF